MSEPVLQSSLGTVNNNSGRSSKTWNDGALNTGQVTKMHHKRSTADTEVFGGPNEIRSCEDQEGQNSPVVCSRYAGYDEEFEKPYGEFIPLQKGDRPVFVYAENDKTKPIIVAVMHHTDEDLGKINLKDILPTEYPIDPMNIREALRYIWIHRTQDGFTIDGENGEFELSSHTKSFIRSCSTNQDEETFDYEDLVLKDKQSIADKDPKTIFLPEKYSFPLKYMAVFRDEYEDELTNYLRFSIDASKLLFKVNRQEKQDNKSTNVQLKEDGEIIVKRQLDGYIADTGEKNTYAKIDTDGNLTAENHIGDIPATLKLEEEKASVEVGPALLEMKKDRIQIKIGGASIELTPAAINIKAPTVNLN